MTNFALKRWASALTLTVGLGVGAVAHAVPDPFLSGSVSFAANGSSSWAFLGTCSSTVDCQGFTLTPPTDNVIVNNATGSFAGIPIGTVGTMAGVDITNLPVTPQWSVSGFSFDLLSATVTTVLNSGGVKFLNLSGTGNAKATGFTDTAGIWSWTGTATGGTFSFAASTTVAEPMSLALMGAGLLGAGLLRRRRRAVTA